MKNLRREELPGLRTPLTLKFGQVSAVFAAALLCCCGAAFGQAPAGPLLEHDGRKGKPVLGANRS